MFLDNPLAEQEGGVVTTLLATPIPCHANISIEVCDEDSDVRRIEHFNEGVELTNEGVELRESYEETDGDSALDSYSYKSEEMSPARDGEEMGLTEAEGLELTRERDGMGLSETGSMELMKEDEVRRNSNTEDLLDINDISFGFKRRSLSFESLMESFREDKSFQYLFQPDPTHLSSLHSLADLSDDSDQEMQDPSNSFSDYDLDASSLNYSFNASSLPDTEERTDDPLPNEDGSDDPVPKSSPVSIGDEGTLHESVSCDHMSLPPPVKFVASRSLDHCPLEADHDSCPLSPPPTQENEGAGSSDKSARLKRRLYKVKRSKSQDSGTKIAVVDNKKQRSSKGLSKPGPQFLRKPRHNNNRMPTPTLPTTPSDMLIRFQIACMGCIMGVASKTELRTVVKESETNSEKDNYAISQEREGD